MPSAIKSEQPPSALKNTDFLSDSWFEGSPGTYTDASPLVPFLMQSADHHADSTMASTNDQSSSRQNRKRKLFTTDEDSLLLPSKRRPSADTEMASHISAMYIDSAVATSTPNHPSGVITRSMRKRLLAVGDETEVGPLPKRQRHDAHAQQSMAPLDYLDSLYLQHEKLEERPDYTSGLNKSRGNRLV